MTITELLRGTGNAGVSGTYVLTLTNGRTFTALRLRHPYMDEGIVGFSGEGFGELRVKVSDVRSVEPS